MVLPQLTIVGPLGVPEGSNEGTGKGCDDGDHAATHNTNNEHQPTRDASTLKAEADRRLGVTTTESLGTPQGKGRSIGRGRDNDDHTIDGIKDVHHTTRDA